MVIFNSGGAGVVVGGGNKIFVGLVNGNEIITLKYIGGAKKYFG